MPKRLRSRPEQCINMMQAIQELTENNKKTTVNSLIYKVNINGQVLHEIANFLIKHNLIFETVIYNKKSTKTRPVFYLTGKGKRFLIKYRQLIDVFNIYKVYGEEFGN